MLPIRLKIDDDFFKEELRDGYLVSKEMKELWAIELDLAAELLKVCKENNLKIWASDGTLLGAIRHEGFIPWDDDMDFQMLRKDYNKLIEIAPTAFKSQYFLSNEQSERTFPWPMMRLNNTETTKTSDKFYLYKKLNCGVGIDIFPVDFIPDDVDGNKRKRIDYTKESVLLTKRLIILADASTLHRSKLIKNKHYVTSSFVEALLSTYTDEEIDEIISKAAKALNAFNSTTANLNSSRCINSGYASFRQRFIYDAEDFNHLEERKFEMLYLPVPTSFEKLLVQQYVDWKTPKKDGIRRYHSEFSFDVHNSYKDLFERGDEEKDDSKRTS